MDLPEFHPAPLNARISCFEKEGGGPLLEIAELTEKRPEDLPEESRFLLEMDFESLILASYEPQAYWVLAMKAEIRGGARSSARRWKWTSRVRGRTSKQARLLSLEYDRVAQVDGVGSRSGKRKPWAQGGNESGNGSNKRFRKPD